MKFLPGTGRGTARAASGGGGPRASSLIVRGGRDPSTKPLRVLVPLPVPGRI